MSNTTAFSTSRSAPFPSSSGSTAGQRRAGLPSQPCAGCHDFPTCFYFTVFFSNNPPIFHSNRIPAELLGLTPPPPSSLGNVNVGVCGRPADGETGSTAGPSPSSSHAPMCVSCRQRRWQTIFADPVARQRGVAAAVEADACSLVGDFRTEVAAVDEVPQQTLQTVAFPTAFGSCGGGGLGGVACSLPVRKLRTRSCRDSSRSTPSPYPSQPLQMQELQHEQEQNGLRRFHDDGGNKGATQDKPDSRRDSAVAQNYVPPALQHDVTAFGIPHANCTQLHFRGVASRASTHQQMTPHVDNADNRDNYPHSMVRLSPHTLPLTTTTSVVPARFQPTFPVVEWKDVEEGDDECPDTAAVVLVEARKGKVEDCGDGGGGCTNTDTRVTRSERDDTTVTGPTLSNAAVMAPTPTPTKTAPTGAPLRARRPRPASSTTTASTVATAAVATAAVAAFDSTSSRSTEPTAKRQGPPPPPPPPTCSSRGAEASSPPLTPSAASPAAAETKVAVAPPPLHAFTTQREPRSSSAVADVSSTTSALPVAAATQEGPPWNMRVEEVRSAKGELRYYRCILTVAFAALITSHTGMMHSMQTRNAAAALVLTCPPSGVHFRFLLHHFDVLRSVMHRTTEFAIRTVQRFFGLLFSPTQKPKGTQQQVLKGITSKLETHSEACDTYRSVKAELASALGLLMPLPLLAPATARWVVPALAQSPFASARTRAGGSKAFRSAAETVVGGSRNRPRFSSVSTPASWPTGNSAVRSPPTPVSLPSLSDMLYDAANVLCDYSEGFASAFVCGLLSLAEDGGGTRAFRARTGVLQPLQQQAHVAVSVSGGECVRDDVPFRRGATPGLSVSRAGSPTTASSREASAAHASSLLGFDSMNAMTVNAATPNWLSAYASYFNAASDPRKQRHADDGSDGKSAEEEVGVGEGDGWIVLSRRPPPTAPQLSGLLQMQHQDAAAKAGNDGDNDDDDACLCTHVSASTVSSMTPVLSPLTVDVEVRSLSAGLPRGRPLSSPSPAAAGLYSSVLMACGSTGRSSNGISGISSGALVNTSLAAPPTLATAQLYTISAETPVTSHAATLAASTTTTNTTTAAAVAANATVDNGSADNAAGACSQTSNPASAAPSPVAAAPTPNTALPRTQPTRSIPAAASAAATPSPGTSTTAAAPAGAKEDEYTLHRGRLGRVVVFTQDATLARSLLLVAAFLWKDCSGADGVGATTTTAASASVPTYLGWQLRQGMYAASSGASSLVTNACSEEAQRMYETAVAAAVGSAEFANVPIQWVCEEFSEARLTALCSRFSPENTLLVVVPRQLQCRRVRLRKHVAGTTVLVEQHAGKEARIRSAAFPFRCSITKQTVLAPDPTVITLLREARNLHQSSEGTVDFAEVFQRMAHWLYWQSAAAVLRRRDAHVHDVVAAAATALQPTLPASTTPSAAPDGPSAEQSRGGGGRLSRYTSGDMLWPSRSASVVDSHGTAPTSATSVALISGFLRPRVPSSTTSASPCSPAMQLERSSTVHYAEEALLPGIRGGVSAAWAYTAASSLSPSGPAVPVTPGSAVTAAAAIQSTTATTTTSTLLVSHGLVQPPSAFVTASPVTVSTPPRSSSLRLLNWFRKSPTTAATTPHVHPVLTPNTLGQLSVGDGGQLPRLLSEDDDVATHVWAEQML
jgi:hypothetical protein